MRKLFQEEDDADLNVVDDNLYAIDSDGEYYLIDQTEELPEVTMGRGGTSSAAHIQPQRQPITVSVSLPPRPSLNLNGVQWTAIDAYLEDETKKREKEMKAEKKANKKREKGDGEDNLNTPNESDDECFLDSDEERDLQVAMAQSDVKAAEKAKRKATRKDNVMEDVMKLLDKDKNDHLKIYLPDSMKKWMKEGDARVSAAFACALRLQLFFSFRVVFFSPFSKLVNSTTMRQKWM